VYDFYRAAALLARQSAVIAMAIPSVCPSVCLSHAGIVPRRMKIGSCGLHCEVAINSATKFFLCENFQLQSCSRTIRLSNSVYMLAVNVTHDPNI